MNAVDEISALDPRTPQGRELLFTDPDQFVENWVTFGDGALDWTVDTGKLIGAVTIASNPILNEAYEAQTGVNLEEEVRAAIIAAGQMAVEDPDAFAASAINWELLETDPIAWAGQAAPEVLIEVVTAGGATAFLPGRRAARAAANAADTASDAANAADAASDAATAAGRAAEAPPINLPVAATTPPVPDNLTRLDNIDFDNINVDVNVPPPPTIRSIAADIPPPPTINSIPADIPPPPTASSIPADIPPPSTAANRVGTPPPAGSPKIGIASPDEFANADNLGDIDDLNLPAFDSAEPVVLESNGAVAGKPPTPETIKIGDVRMLDHPDFHIRVAELEAKGYTVNVDPNFTFPHVKIVETTKLDGTHVIDLTINLPPDIRYLDFEHELIHVQNFEQHGLVTDRLWELPDGRLKNTRPSGAPEASGNFLTSAMAKVEELYTRMVEYKQLFERGADEALLAQHAEGIADWQRQASRTLRYKADRVSEIYPDFDELASWYAEASR